MCPWTMSTGSLRKYWMPTIQSVNSSSSRRSDGSSRSTSWVSVGRARSTGIALTNQSASTRVRRPAPSVSQAARIRPPADVVPLQALAVDELHAEVAQVPHPRVDPGLVGGQVEHPVQCAVVAAAEDVHHERLAHVADRAGAGEGLLRGDQAAGQPGGEHPLVLPRPRAGAHEVPPADLLPLAEPALVAAGEEDQQPLDEVGELVRRDGAAGQVVEQVAAQAVDGEQLDRVRADPEDEPVGALAGAQELAVRRVGQVVAHGAAAERDPPHRVRHVVVEAREEPEAVLAGQVPAAATAGAGHRDAAGLAAPRAGS